jgi:integrase
VDTVKARGKPSAAHHVLAYARGVFNYAIARDIIDQSPCDRLKPSMLIGPKGTRHRVLDDDEIKCLWDASERIGYPYGPLWQLLLITGQRRGEVGEAEWSELI